MNTIKEKCVDILLFVKEQNDITNVAYNTWLKPLRVSDQLIDGTVTILVPNDPPHALEYIKMKYDGALKEACHAVTGEVIDINFGIRFYLDAES